VGWTVNDTRNWYMTAASLVGSSFTELGEP
jgi:hypothetical protein